MDLKSGCLFWPERARDEGRSGDHFNGLQSDIECEIAVIGAGITGALAAFHLAEAGVDVAVFDCRQPACGSSAASTGLLQYEIDTLLCDLREMVGAQHAARAYLLSLKSIADFEALVQRLDDRSDFVIRPSLYLASSPHDVETLRREHMQRREIGIDVELLGAADVRQRFGFDRPAALYSTRAAEVDPYRLTLSLHRAAIARGARVFGDTEVQRYESDKLGVTLRTMRGHQVRARKIIFATGYETPEFVDRKLCKLKSTYALASEPLGKVPIWHEQCLIWEHRRPYFYARSTSDGRAMIGGGDIESADPKKRDSFIPEKAQELVDGLAELFPRLTINKCCAWAGTFAETKDGLPYIGSLPEFPHGYFALGYGGNGITFSLIAAQILRDVIVGRYNPDAELFRFSR